jgi:hypothetical protein
MAGVALPQSHDRSRQSTSRATTVRCHDSTVLFESPKKGGANEYLWLGRGDFSQIWGGVVAFLIQHACMTIFGSGLQH